jgi:transmembrane sensor
MMNAQSNLGMDTPLGSPPLHGVDWAIKAGVTGEVMLATRIRVRRRRQRRLAAAFGLAVVLFAGGFWLSVEYLSSLTVRTPASAIVEMPRRQTLSDGSVVELKDDSRIYVAYSPDIRRVTLLKGEAHFQVAKNKDRPFAVVIGNVEVRAVGTAFSVQRSDGSVEVLVTEGRVTLGSVPAYSHDSEYSAPQKPADSKTIATLDAGNRAIINITYPVDSSPALTIEAVSASEISQRLAWRIPQLEFTKTPLRDVIKMINEHSHERLLLADKSLENVRISGILRANHIEMLLRLLYAEDGINAEYQRDGEIVLTRGR